MSSFAKIAFITPALVLFGLIQPAFAAEAAAAPSPILQWIFPIAIFAMFYFLVIRPQSKRAKEHKNMVEALAVNNEIIFAGGLMGRIKAIEGDYAIVSLNDHNEVMVQRSSVISVLPNGTIEGVANNPSPRQTNSLRG